MKTLQHAAVTALARARGRGYLELHDRNDELENAWANDRKAKDLPVATLRRGRRTASVEVDLYPTSYDFKLEVIERFAEIARRNALSSNSWEGGGSTNIAQIKGIRLDLAEQVVQELLTIARAETVPHRLAR